MRKEPRSTATACMAYHLPEEAYHALSNTRDHLRLLARLSEPRNLADCHELPLSPVALAYCFDRLATDLDEIVRATWWSKEEDRGEA